MSIDKLIIEKYIENHTDEAVKKISLLTDSEILSIIKNLRKENVYKVFCRIERYRAVNVFDLLDTKDVAEILINIPTNIAVLIMRQMNKDKLNPVLMVLSDKKVAQFTTMLQYDVLSVGAVMDTDVFTLIDDILIHDALENIKRYDGKIPVQIFIVDRDQKLKGKIDLHQLIGVNARDELRTIIDSNVPKISPKMNIKSVFDHKGWQEYYSLPVIDSEDMFLGIITLEIIRNIIETKSKKELTQFTAVGSALGELYRLGLSGLIRSAAEISTKPKNDNRHKI
jgi:magnesium transporter